MQRVERLGPDEPGGRKAGKLRMPAGRHLLAGELTHLERSPMDFKLLLKRLLGRPTCLMASGARLGRTARIINIGRHSNQIDIGSGSVINGELLVFAHGGSIHIGEWCFVGEGARIWSAGMIDIGHRVMISHNVNIFDNLTHPLSAEMRHRHFHRIATFGHPKSVDLGERNVRIFDDVWIAAGATVLRGVTIGRGAIVGAGSVVTHDVAPWTVVGGNPARVIGHLEPEEQATLPAKSDN